jgi:hypothetical protein
MGRRPFYGVCKCADAGCPVHTGKTACGGKATVVLVRVDMDNARVLFCQECAEDALQSGVFAEA